MTCERCMTAELSGQRKEENVFMQDDIVMTLKDKN